MIFRRTRAPFFKVLARGNSYLLFFSRAARENFFICVLRQRAFVLRSRLPCLPLLSFPFCPAPRASRARARARISFSSLSLLRRRGPKNIQKVSGRKTKPNAQLVQLFQKDILTKCVAKFFQKDKGFFQNFGIKSFWIFFSQRW